MFATTPRVIINKQIRLTLACVNRPFPQHTFCRFIVVKAQVLVITLMTVLLKCFSKLVVTVNQHSSFSDHQFYYLHLSFILSLHKCIATFKSQRQLSHYLNSFFRQPSFFLLCLCMLHFPSLALDVNPLCCTLSTYSHAMVSWISYKKLCTHFHA